MSKAFKELGVCFVAVAIFVAIVTNQPKWTFTLFLSLLVLSAAITPFIWGAYRLARLILQI